MCWLCVPAAISDPAAASSSARRLDAQPEKLNLDLMKRIAAIFMVIAFYALHQDQWFWSAARPLVFGFLPIGLFYHTAYMAASSIVLWTLVSFLWPSHLEKTPKTHE
jgi:hypothetical protein